MGRVSDRKARRNTDAGSIIRSSKGLLLPRVNFLCTLPASLSGTFLQTLPDLGISMPLKGYSLSAVHRRGQRPPKGLSTDKTVEAA